VGRALALLLAAAAICLCLSSPVAAASPSARDFTRAAALDDVSISRDGKHIVALTSPDSEQVTISVWRADAPNQPPATLGSKRMRFLSVRFLKDDRLLVFAIQPITIGDLRGHLTKTWITDLEGKRWTELLPDRPTHSEDVRFINRLVNATLLDSLPLDPQFVLVEDHRPDGEGDVYRVNAYTGAAQRVERGSERFENPQADLKGEIRAKVEVNYEGGKVYLAQWIKHPDTGAWEEHFRSYARDREITEILGFMSDPGIVYIRSSKGRDKAGVYLYDVRARKILEPAFEHKLFEATAVVRSRAQADYGEPLGFVYDADSPRVYWTDAKLGGLAKGLETALGIARSSIDWVDPGGDGKTRLTVADSAGVQIVSMSADRKLMIVEKSGPKQAGEFYLFSDEGKLTLLGRARPWIDPASLGDTRLVEYAARDGLMIPAFLTTPPKAVFGPGPYPTLIEPHGGPWARDDLGWDVIGWVQYFASRGYAVLQPQFRGSEGWGQKLWRAGDGQWGQAMQDDKDDGVKWLVAQGIADPKRVAMFGYSYGGYAALAAAIRPGGLYQCAISGAGAGDLASISRATFDNRFQREFQHPTIKGLDALEHAGEASIPVFLYHGDRDQTVDIKQSRKFAAALRAAGKPYRLLEIPDMGHQYVTMTPAMMETQLVEIEKFLKSECKPGGL
jgi:acetyl esterase/lipase